MIRRITVSLPLVAVIVVACSDRTANVIAYESSPPPAFVDPAADASTADASTSTADASRPWVEYCPANECPAGWGKCRSEQFECEVDFSSNVSNCGGCGKACPQLANSTEACVEGACRYQCENNGPVVWADCNGFPDDGCEVKLKTNENCRFCGDVCDPEHPCIINPDTFEAKCGCDPGLTLCGDRACADLETSNENCGSCGNQCDLSNGGTAAPHVIYVCEDGTCGHRTCHPDWGNCDGDWDNGCETDLTRDVSCGDCNLECAAGVHCLKDAFERNVCGCPDGLTYCDGECFDLEHDYTNCGTCGRACARRFGELCVNGECVMSCDERSADCNGLVEDGCETNIWSDPLNCGGCGIECPGVGQACVVGTCAVAPCDQDAPEAAR